MRKVVVYSTYQRAKNDFNELINSTVWEEGDKIDHTNLKISIRNGGFIWFIVCHVNIEMSKLEGLRVDSVEIWDVLDALESIKNLLILKARVMEET